MLNEIEQAIELCAQNLAARAHQENWRRERDWTKNLMSDLARLGQVKWNFFVCGHGCSEFGGQGEWLYDLVWLDKNDGFISDVALILESEWSIIPSEIRKDFEKLLVGRSSLRVLVFQQPLNVEAIFDSCIEMVKRFNSTRAGDRYLFLGLNNSTGSFMTRSFVAGP